MKDTNITPSKESYMISQMACTGQVHAISGEFYARLFELFMVLDSSAHYCGCLAYQGMSLFVRKGEPSISDLTLCLMMDGRYEYDTIDLKEYLPILVDGTLASKIVETIEGLYQTIQNY